MPAATDEARTVAIVVRNPVPVDVTALGTRAVILQPRAEQTLDIQRRLWALGREVERWPEVEEIVFGMTNLMVVCRSHIRAPETFTERLVAQWDLAEGVVPAARVVDVPTTYGGEFAIDLAALCTASGLTVSEIAKLHSEWPYDVFAVGSVPGFAYLGGLHPKLFMPRKKTPALRIEKGSLIIGGMQTAISTVTGPGGWNAIGHCDVALFDASQSPPCLLAPGDRVRFIIDRVHDV